MGGAREDRACDAAPIVETAVASDAGAGTDAGGAGLTIQHRHLVRIVESYHARLPMLPRAVGLNDGRKRALRRLVQRVMTERRLADGTTRANTVDGALTWIDGYFELAARNPFVTGRTKPGVGHENWRADIDYLATDRGWKQVVEKTEVPA